MGTLFSHRVMECVMHHLVVYHHMHTLYCCYIIYNKSHHQLYQYYSRLAVCLYVCVCVCWSVCLFIHLSIHVLCMYSSTTYRYVISICYHYPFRLGPQAPQLLMAATAGSTGLTTCINW